MSLVFERPIDLGEVNQSLFNEAFIEAEAKTEQETCLPVPGVERQLTVVDAVKQLLSGVIAIYDIPINTIHNVQAAEATATFDSYFTRNGTTWHGNIGRGFKLAVFDAPGLEFLSGTVSRDLERKLRKYPYRGYKGNRDFYSHLQTVLEDYRDDDLLASGLDISSTEPYHAYAFREPCISREAVYRDGAAGERRALRASVDAPLPDQRTIQSKASSTAIT